MTDEEHKKYLQTKISEFASVKDMVNHEGWKIVLQHFAATIALIKEGLTQEIDFKHIVRLQERHRAFSDMLRTVDTMYAQCDKYRETLQRLEEEAQFKEQYGN